MANPFQRTRIFFVEMVEELKKASWPTRTELRDATLVVIAASAILGVFTAVSDFALSQVVDLFTSFVQK